MVNPNPLQKFDVVWGGIEVARADGRRGTLGMLLTSDRTDRWVLTACHVLGIGNPPIITPGHDLLQPAFQQAANVIANTSTAVTIPGVDCAAAKLTGGMRWIDTILGVGPMFGLQPKPPSAKQRVIKCGAGSGVTEGWVDQILRDANNNPVEIVIAIPPDVPDACVLSRDGDSGSIWVDAATRQPVALHTGGNAQGSAEFATAIPIQLVLNGLGLRIPW